MYFTSKWPGCLRIFTNAQWHITAKNILSNHMHHLFSEYLSPPSHAFCPNAISKSVLSLTTVLTAPNQLCSFPDLPETACDIQFVSDLQRTDGGNEGHFKGSEARIRGCLGIESVIGTSAEAREIGNTWTAVTSNARGTGEGDEKNLPTYLKYQACYSTCQHYGLLCWF